ncbi:alanine--tRNA ligase [Slackia heliotrinireducens]|uniref:Alanine--tRNA ligase n=1 Tax=Slackia heliotrinireducens (strain ATCC 29202 / DSM 20476 / NCTC 11029 / RHS 1) TaxID=471855 RepID=C7N4K1_SLAHD|nr:alanine--tRNA ligase [Slackia heliotrinireducens]ACV21836.1 alanyl-tRNA synthetase [Slackia heliotrinireducens DSM 20476]VEG99568.1 Alanine--tRNA ligase [Slackia heliotrinireducens]
MRYMTTAEIREKYLKFFEGKACKRLPSSSLIPDDPSLLLTSAGMVQFKPYFLHVKEFDPAYVGAATVQKCVRTNDIDIIGTTGRHLSFFEMLGNFSFGKYFKKEMCAWAWEFCLNELELPKEKLYFTVFEDDDETIEIWKSLGVEDSHISRLGEDDNFWRAGPTGPCGPCSEIYYDQGPEFGCGDPNCAPGCDCDRFLEFWNCVFTQYDGQEDGTLAPLPTKNIDTGMGLERMAAIMQGVQSNFDTDVIRGLIAVGERLSGKSYVGKANTVGHGSEQGDIDLSLRICADHSRSVAFMIADGILPSNEGRGYVLRRLLRRAVMHGRKLGIEGAFLNEYVAVIVDLMGHVYPEIVENRALVESVIASEEGAFANTLRQGQAYLAEALKNLEGTTLSGDVAFKLHDTYGFPVEVTEEICSESGISVDHARFEECMNEQRERARAATKDDAEAAWSTYGSIYADLLKELGPTKFVGYEGTDYEGATIKAIIRNGELVGSLHRGEEGEIVLDTTPFYAEMGGEVGDTGMLHGTFGVSEVLDTKAPEKGLVCHRVRVIEGDCHAVDETVNASVDAQRRALITRNHTATHLLHAALREVLGDHVKQKGSYVGPDRLRFDFTHFEGMTPEQIAEVERVANEKVMQAIPTTIYETSLNAAREAGVTALFGEKYGDTVRVVEAGEFSRELCGGCHVSNTAEIGFIKIVSEGSSAANVRRIEALTSVEALNYMNAVEAELKETAAELRVPMFDVSERTASNLATIKDYETKAKNAKKMAAEGNIAEHVKDVVNVGYPLLVVRIDGLDTGGLRNAWDIIRARMETPGACIIGTVNNDKPIIMAAGTDEAVAAGFNAGAVIKNIAGNIKGGGGGKPSMAQAGGKDASGLDAALQAARDMLGA